MQSFEQVVAAFANNNQTSYQEGKGFGSNALKANGKIFAMLSSSGRFVVKLPSKRVDELISAGEGDRFDPGHGRRMKEWVVVENANTDWIELAKEAYEFVAVKTQTSIAATRRRR